MLFAEEAGFRIYCLILLSLYLAFGFYGVLWVSDEFDHERSLFYGVFAVPLAVLFTPKLGTTVVASTSDFVFHHDRITDTVIYLG